MTGPWEKYRPQGGQGAPQPRVGQVFSLPPDPQQTFENNRATRNDAINQANEAARLNLDQENAERQRRESIARINAELYPKGLQLGPDGVNPVPIPNWKPPVNPNATPLLTAKERADAIAAYVAANQMDGLIADMEGKFKDGPGATKGVAGIQDFLPTQANDRFDKAGQAVRGQVGTLLGFTGGQLNQAREAEMAVGPYLPTSGNFDATALDKIARLKDLVKTARQRSVAILGGVPDDNGNITPLGANATPPAAPNAGNTPPPPPGTGPNGAPGGNPPTNGPTLGLSRGENFTSPQDLAVAAAVTKAFQSGADIDGLVKAAQGAGGQITPQDLANFQQAIRARSSGQAVTFNPQATGRRTPFEAAAGNALMSPVGTAAATAISGTGFNALDGILPDQMQALRSLNPGMASLGDIGGALAGTSALGKIGTKAVEMALPSMSERVLGGGGLARFSRQLAGDTAYGTSYGANVNGDAIGGAIGGVLGSAGGQLVGKGIGAALRGVQRSPVAQKVYDALGGNMTIGQQLGGPVKAFEDAATSIPGVGDMVNGLRNDSIYALNRAGFREASGGAVDQVGDAGLDALRTNTGSAYDTALLGKQFPLDPQFTPDFAAAQQARARLMPDYQAKFDTAINNRVTPIVDQGVMTGKEYQQVQRGLRDYKGARGADGFENDYRDAIGGVQNTLRDNVLRSADPETVGQLGQADWLYRSQKIIEDAINRNRKDASGIGNELFRPGDLTEAAFQSGKKYGMNNAPLLDLAKAAQQVIPSKLADSGTARRGMTGALAAAGLGGLAGGGYGAATGENGAMDAVGGGAAGGVTGLGLLGLLAAGATKPGQRALAEVLFNRPASLANFGRKVGERKGLFGTATVPLLLQSGN